MKEALYETVTHADTPNNPSGQPGRKLFKFSDFVRWYLLAAAVYAAGAIAAAVWILTGPSLGWKQKILRVSSDMPVKQLYSGIALSFLLAPAAVVIRRIAYDLALLQPLAIASAKPISLSHLDAIMNPGIYAAGCMTTYSWTSALIQIFLLISGAALVPVGTLTLTTGPYNAPSERMAVVGMPILGTDPIVLINPNTSLPAVLEVMDEQRLSEDLFLQLLVNTVTGVITQQMGKLASVNETLGPVPSANFTYEEGVTYHSVVTYTWQSGCQYTNETIVAIEGAPFGEPFPAVNATITFPGQAPLQVAFPDEIMFNTTNAGPGQAPLDQELFASYFVLGGVNNYTANWDELPPGTQHDDRVWWSSIKCTPAFDWGVGSCTFRNGSMVSCQSTPGKNVTALDDFSLDLLPAYFTRLPGVITELDLRLGNRPLLSIPTLSDIRYGTAYYRAPSVEHFDMLYGLFAQSIAAMTTNGYVGSALVSTSGLPSRTVYIARTYIVAITLFLLIFAPALAAFEIWRLKHKGRPLRRATFLTVANAVRGPWWDRLLWGYCANTTAELQSNPELARTYVMFGADETCPQHVGLAVDVRPVEKEMLYFGMDGNGNHCRKRL